jgi:hypothetical protein
MANSKKNTSKRSAKQYVDTITTITPDARKRLITEAAHQLAEQRGFKGNCQLHDWLEAEAKIDHIYGKAEEES